MKLYGSLDNRLETGLVISKIEVGVGATELYYTDKEPYTIVRIFDERHIIVRKCNASRIDNNGASECQSYEYQTQEKIPYEADDPLFLVSERRKKEIKKYNLGCNEKVLTLTKKGYKEMGSCNGWLIGKRERYFDYSF